jgi:NAD(P)-dependent dehydrogenase (short-subunit alcohol dehydrogenase family)
MKPKAIVTGGTTGIGFGIATAMLNDGYDVTVTGLTDEQVSRIPFQIFRIPLFRVHLTVRTLPM